MLGRLWFNDDASWKFQLVYLLSNHVIALVLVRIWKIFVFLTITVYLNAVVFLVDIIGWNCIFCNLTMVIIVPHHTTTILRPFFRDHPGEPVPEENFWTLWCKGRLTEADTPTIRLGATPSGLTSVHLHHPPIFFTSRMAFLPTNQQRQSTKGN